MAEGCCPQDAALDARESRCRTDKSRTLSRWGERDPTLLTDRLRGVARDPSALLRQAESALDPRVLRLRPRSTEAIQRDLHSTKELWSRSIRCSADWGRLALRLADGHLEYHFAASLAPGEDDKLLEQALTWYQKSQTVSCAHTPQLSPEDLAYAQYFSARMLLRLGRKPEAIELLKTLCTERRPSTRWSAYARVQLRTLGNEPAAAGCSPAPQSSPWVLFELLVRAHDRLGPGDVAGSGGAQQDDSTDALLHAALDLLGHRSDQVGTELVLRSTVPSGLPASRGVGD